uniref:ATP synthase subunit s, mitochondrial n=1 Tax=Rhabditophanes sp. KR3021 TaxID=114890 RepID=A0AC35TXL5_9BILA
MLRGASRSFEQFKTKLVSNNFPGLRWIIEGFNMVDKERLTQIGADRLAAEWIVKCGGKIKFNTNEMFEDYNALVRSTAELDPRKPEDDVKLIWMDATKSSITGYGCLHFHHLKHIKDVVIRECPTFHDHGIEYMGMYSGDIIKNLEITQCPKITEHGLAHLKAFTGLETLTLGQLKNVYHKNKIHKFIVDELPNCKVTYVD